MARYYHSLGLYFPCTIGATKVLLFKSGLHLAYDGPATPLKKLVAEIAQTIKPKVLITTGTGGGIGKTTALGDVVIGPVVKFDCTTQFKNEPWAKAMYSACAPSSQGTHGHHARPAQRECRPTACAPTPKIWHRKSRRDCYYGLLWFRRLDRPLWPTRPGSSLRDGRRHGGASPSSVSCRKVVRDQKRFRPTNRQSQRRHESGKVKMLAGTDTKYRAVHDRRKCYRHLGRD